MTVRARKISPFLLRLDQKLRKNLSSYAAQSQQSVNSLCVSLLEQGLKEPRSALENAVKMAVDIYKDDGLVGVILFGSQARGDATSSSDIDLLFVFNGQTKIQKSLYRKWSDDLYSIHCVSQPVFKNDITSFWFEIALDGKLLWSKDDTIARSLRLIKMEICSGKYVRKISHGHPYWLKQDCLKQEMGTK